jgi:hypothetical protein
MAIPESEYAISNMINVGERKLPMAEILVKNNPIAKRDFWLYRTLRTPINSAKINEVMKAPVRTCPARPTAISND